MNIQFHMVEEWMHFLDPTNDWQPFSRKTEVRYDPLTGQTSRVLFYPLGQLRPPDYAQLAEKTKEIGCPFCPDRVNRMTPKFSSDFCPDERFRKGEAVIFPNMFPYGKHSAVGIFSGNHYLRPEEFHTELLTDGFALAAEYLTAVNRNDPASKYASVNWNYMPMAGASIIHPHIQIIASSEPSNYLSITMQAARNYYSRYESDYFADLIKKEKELQQRYIGETGRITWLSAFAPQGLMDIYAIFSDCRSLSQFTLEDWLDFSQGLIHVVHYFKEHGLISFNLAIYIPMEEIPGYSIHARIIPRTTLGIIHTSDINYFKTLHNEALSLKKPEDAAQEIQEFFKRVNHD